jgi:catechol 2,3-dioxygenase
VFASLTELLAAYSRLKDHGIAPPFNLDYGMTLSIYYPDPDGNLLELQVDTFADWAASRQWMASAPEIAANPIGVQFDPDKLVLARAEGLSDQEIHRRAYTCQYAPANPVDLGT